MKILHAFVILILTTALHLPVADAQGLSCDDARNEARLLSSTQRFDAALAVLSQACSDQNETADSRLQAAQILAWAGRYDEAETAFNEILINDPDNLDVLVGRASLHYYQNELKEAKKVYQSVVDRAPTYSDAITGLARVEEALKAADEALGPTWRLDVNYGETRVDGPQPNWAELTTRAAYRRGEYSYSTQVSQLDRFGLQDTEVVLGLDRVARSGTNFSAYASFTPDADFRSDFGAGGGISHIVEPKWGPVLQAGIKYDFDQFGSNSIHAISPELTAYFENGLVLSGRVINVIQESQVTTGWLAQVYLPLGDRFAARAGYAQAPEIIDGEALDTQSIFGGLSVKITDTLELSFNYSRDDRETAFDREGFSLALTFRR